MTATSTQPTLLQRAFDLRNRADPYPIYAELQKTPVLRQPDGSYVVSKFDHIAALLHDPRIASRGPAGGAGGAGADSRHAAFIGTDPPLHDRLRRQTARHFGPPHSPDVVAQLEPWVQQTVDRLTSELDGKETIDVVDDFAYPLPVLTICRLLGVPPEDESRFHKWSEALITALGIGWLPGDHRDVLLQAVQANTELGEYLAGLLDAHRKDPGDDILSGLVTDKGGDAVMDDEDILATARLLLIAGHETTVNLIANGALTLLRHPEHLPVIGADPDYAIAVVEELLRFEPPVQVIPSRQAVADIEVGGTTIPQDAQVALVLAAGNRDPDRFEDPDAFRPGRADAGHLGFSAGIHYCFGAPLARLEVQLALRALAGRLENSRLVEDPPPYRPSPILRGPRHLRVRVDGVRSA